MSFSRSKAALKKAALKAHASAFALALLAAGAVVGPFALPAAAGERTPFETVAGWEVERDVADADGNACLMSRAYKDKDDDDAENVVVFKRYGTDVALVLGYENWEWSKDEKVKVPFLIGTKVVDAKSTWIGDGTILKAMFPGSIVPNMLAAKTVELRIKGAQAEFEIPGFAQGYEALLRCDSAPPAAKVAQVPAKDAPAKEAPAAPAEKEPLRMVKVQFVTRAADTFGNIAARQTGPFAAGEKLQVYLEVEGQTMVAGEGNKRLFNLSLDYEVLNEGRRVVAGQKAIIDQEFTLDAQGRPNVFFDVGLTLTGMEPGPYTLNLTLHDKRDGRTSNASLPFTVTVPTSDAQAKAYFVGLLSQRTVATCDIATTAKERAALDAKVAALQPKDAAFEKELRAEADKTTLACPGEPDKEKTFRDNLRELVDLTPEAYVERLAKRIAEREAAATSKP